MSYVLYCWPDRQFPTMPAIHSLLRKFHPSRVVLYNSWRRSNAIEILILRLPALTKIPWKLKKSVSVQWSTLRHIASLPYAILTLLSLHLLSSLLSSSLLSSPVHYSTLLSFVSFLVYGTFSFRHLHIRLFLRVCDRRNRRTHFVCCCVVVGVGTNIGECACLSSYLIFSH